VGGTGTGCNVGGGKGGNAEGAATAGGVTENGKIQPRR